MARRTLAVLVWWCALSVPLLVTPRAQSGHGMADHAAAIPGGQPAALTLDVFHAAGVAHLLIGEDDGHGPVLVYRRSTDAGRTWSEPLAIESSRNRLSGTSRGTDPQLVAAGDRLAVLWMAKGSSSRGNGLMERAFSSDGGRTWSSADRVNDVPAAVSQAFIDATADAAGVMHAVWLDSRDGGQGLRASASRDGGRTWSAAATIDARTCECCWNTVTTLGDGTLAVLYRDKDPRDMAIARSTTGGVTWTRAATVGAFGWAFSGCPHVGGALAPGPEPGHLYAYVWTGHDSRRGAYVLRSTDSGLTWSGPVAVGPADAWHVDLVRVGHALVAAWDVNRPGDAHIAWAWSADEGRTWTEGGRLSAPGVRPSHPRLVAGPGVATALWTERVDGISRWVHRTVELGPSTH